MGASSVESGFYVHASQTHFAALRLVYREGG
jgi:hypothetical protein